MIVQYLKEVGKCIKNFFSEADSKRLNLSAEMLCYVNQVSDAKRDENCRARWARRVRATKTWPAGFCNEKRVTRHWSRSSLFAGSRRDMDNELSFRPRKVTRWVGEITFLQLILNPSRWSRRTSVIRPCWQSSYVFPMIMEMDMVFQPFWS